VSPSPPKAKSLSPELALFIYGLRLGLQLRNLPQTIPLSQAPEYMGYSPAYFWTHIRPHLPVIESPGTGVKRQPKKQVRLADLDFWIADHLVLPQRLTLKTSKVA